MRLVIAFFALLSASNALAEGFSSPSQNIACYSWQKEEHSSDFSVDCLIFEQNWSAEQIAKIADSEAGCTLDETVTAHIQPSGAASIINICHGDVFWDYKAAQTSLPYGEKYQFFEGTNAIICTSERTGMTCKNQDGRGFTLAKSAYQLF